MTRACDVIEHSHDVAITPARHIRKSRNLRIELPLAIRMSERPLTAVGHSRPAIPVSAITRPLSPFSDRMGMPRSCHSKASI
jgi:hypothetical protein